MKDFYVTIHAVNAEGDGLLAEGTLVQAESYQGAMAKAITEFVTPYEDINNVRMIIIETEYEDNES